MCCFAAPNNRCFSGKRQRHPPPPPRWLTQRGIEWEAPHKYFATQRFQHLWHLFVCHTAITCHKVAITLLSPSLALMLGSTTYPEHCSENISPKCTRKQRAVRGMHHLQKQPPPMQIAHPLDHRLHPLVQIPPAGGWLLWGSGCWGPLTPRQKQ